MDEIEPIKASTLAQFYWCAIDAYIEHLREIGDERVTGDSEHTKATREGERLHAKSFGLRVYPMEEDTGRAILEKMKQEQVTAINHGEYQIQGAPDIVVQEGESVRVEDMKTTSWDDKEFYSRYQLPPAEFQTQIYSWMLSHVPNLEIENPAILVKRREDDRAVNWFEEEVEFNRNRVEEKIERVLNLFQEPEKLADYRPSVDWKCKKDDHWEQYQRIVLGG